MLSMVTKSQIMGLLDNGVMELDLREMGLLFIGKVYREKFFEQNIFLI